MDYWNWKGYAIVLSLAVAIGIMAEVEKVSTLNSRIEALQSQRADAIQALEEVQTSLWDLEREVQGVSPDFESLDPSADFVIEPVEPDPKFEEIQSAIGEVEKVLTRHKALVDVP